MKLGREVSRHNELDNWRNTHRFESVMATKWLLLTISETEPGLWDRLLWDRILGGQSVPTKTLDGRRKRCREAVLKLIECHDWVANGSYYEFVGFRLTRPE